MFGQPFMPHQRLVAEVGGELDADGRPAYREVVVTINRQSGKSVLTLAWQVQRARGWEHLGPQSISYSAQAGVDSRKKLLDDWAPLIEPRKKLLGVRRILRANGSEGVEFDNGSKVSLLAGTEQAGHGKTIDLAVKDEFFADHDDRRDQALVPAMATRKFGQVLTASTAGTADSVPLNRLIARGRAAVAAGKRDGIAYFEWSADEDDDPDDPDVWWACMPALGHTISVEVVEHARRTLTDAEFRRAFLNIPTIRSESRLIPVSVWDAVCSPGHQPSGQLVFAVDVNPERSAAAVASSDGSSVELVEHRPGTGWLAQRCAELDARWGPASWVLDQGGPAGSLVVELERAGVRVDAMSRREMVGACGVFFDAVVDRRVKVRSHSSLDAAVGAVGKRSVGDAWMWSRKGAADICPLVAVTLAFGAGQGRSGRGPLVAVT